MPKARDSKIQHVELSVVMATYNGERYLARQLESIKDQTRLPDELVVGDDGSVDETVGILTDFQKIAPFQVTLIHRNRVGVAMNFLLTVQASRGSLIAFADQDDVWLPEKLERSLDALHRYRADVVIHGAKPVDAELRTKRTGYRNVRKTRVEERLQGNVWATAPGNAMLFRRNILDGCDWTARPESQWSDHPFYHDTLVKVLASVRGRTVRLPDRLLLYRQHSANVAGAPMTLTDGVRKYSGHIGHAASLEYRARIVRDWAHYFAALVDPERQPETVAYFLGAADLMRARAERLRRSFWRALPSISTATVRGEYSTHTTGGFGWRALLQDLYHCYHLGTRRS
jgi:glycosyltransferase involved in cell wall biosynthesis